MALGARAIEEDRRDDVVTFARYVVRVLADLSDEDFDALPPELRRNLQRLAEAVDMHADAAEYRRAAEDRAVGR